MRTVKVAISRKMLEHLLNVPEGIEVRSMDYDFNSNSIWVRLEGDHLPEIPERKDGEIIQDEWVLPDYGYDGKPCWPSLEKK